MCDAAFLCVSLGAVGLQSGSRSSTETLPGGELHPLPHLGEGTPMRFTSEPNRHELQASWQFLAILGMLQCFAISERSCVSAQQWVVLHCCWRLHFKAIISFQCTCMRMYTYMTYRTYLWYMLYENQLPMRICFWFSFVRYCILVFVKQNLWQPAQVFRLFRKAAPQFDAFSLCWGIYGAAGGHQEANRALGWSRGTIAPQYNGNVSEEIADR